jgi:hypothetical protein
MNFVEMLSFKEATVNDLRINLKKIDQAGFRLSTVFCEELYLNHKEYIQKVG